MISLSQLSGFTTVVGVSIGSLAVVCAGAGLAIEGYTTVGALFGFFTLLLNLQTAAALVGAAIPELAKAAGGLGRIDALLSLEPITEPDGAAALPHLADAIVFRDLSFTYPGATARRLDGLELTIRRGETVAFVGPSGSGKSTALKLLMRRYEPDSGDIDWDGQPLSGVPRAAHWANLGVVLQDTTLFDDTIRENIRLGRLGFQLYWQPPEGVIARP